jgi:hypothetical protein
MVTTSDASGHYVFRQVLPGTFKLLAAQDLRDVRVGDSSLEDYEDSMTTIEVHADDRITQDLKLAPPAK